MILDIISSVHVVTILTRIYCGFMISFISGFHISGRVSKSHGFMVAWPQTKVYDFLQNLEICMHKLQIYAFQPLLQIFYLWFKHVKQFLLRFLHFFVRKISKPKFWQRKKYQLLECLISGPSMFSSIWSTNGYTKLDNLAWSQTVFLPFTFYRRGGFMKPLLSSSVAIFIHNTGCLVKESALRPILS